MARPQFPAPVFPSKDSPSKSGTGKCGSSYHMTYSVHAPYKGVDKYSNNLPVAYSDTEIGVSDINASLPAIIKGAFNSALKEAIKGASEILHSYDKDGYIDDTNKAVILQLISRANKYQTEARKIKEWWDGVYQPDPEVAVYGWGLNEESSHNCPGFAPTKGGVYTGNTVIEFTCPTPADGDLHDADRIAYQQLLYAAMLNARCAQEAAATVGTHNRNKEFFESISGGMGLATAPPPKSPGKTITTGGPPTSDHPEDPEVEPESEPAPKAKKKKDNTLLIAGAAGLGLLILKGRK